MKRSKLTLFGTPENSWEIQYRYNDRVQAVIPLGQTASGQPLFDAATIFVAEFNASQPEE